MAVLVRLVADQPEVRGLRLPSQALQLLVLEAVEVDALVPTLAQLLRVLVDQEAEVMEAVKMQAEALAGSIPAEVVAVLVGDFLAPTPLVAQVVQVL